VGSDNPDGAENQQERLIRVGWVIGFVDGEGCFSIGFTRQSERGGRRGYKTGFQVSHSLVVVQGAKSVSCLHDLRSFFGVGNVSINRRYDNHKEHLYRYVVCRREHLSEVIIPFFRANPLRSSKRSDFERFTECLAIVNSGRHLTAEGLIAIARLTEKMNHQRSRSELIRILRGHTPDTLDTG
jgi:LAGLIDADG DNA endonuclease family protein